MSTQTHTHPHRSIFIVVHSCSYAGLYMLASVVPCTRDHCSHTSCGRWRGHAALDTMSTMQLGAAYGLCPSRHQRGTSRRRRTARRRRRGQRLLSVLRCVRGDTRGDIMLTGPALTVPNTKALSTKGFSFFFRVFHSSSQFSSHRSQLPCLGAPSRDQLSADGMIMAASSA